MTIATQYEPDILSQFERIKKNDLSCLPVIQEMGAEFLSAIKKVEQSDLGFHPDTVLATLDSPQAHPSRMQGSVVRGDDFLAVRCAPVGQHNEQHAKVELAYLSARGKPKFLKLGKEMSKQECANFLSLLKGEQVLIDNILWKKI